MNIQTKNTQLNIFSPPFICQGETGETGPQGYSGFPGNIGQPGEKVYQRTYTPFYLCGYHWEAVCHNIRRCGINLLHFFYKQEFLSNLIDIQGEKGERGWIGMSGEDGEPGREEVRFLKGTV